MTKIRTTMRPHEISEVGPQDLAALQHWGLILEYVQEEDAFDDETVVEAPAPVEQAEDDTEEPEPVVPPKRRRAPRKKRTASPDTDQGSVGE